MSTLRPGSKTLMTVEMSSLTTSWAVHRVMDTAAESVYEIVRAAADLGSWAESWSTAMSRAAAPGSRRSRSTDSTTFLSTATSQVVMASGTGLSGFTATCFPGGSNGVSVAALM
ncbi:hypothetical protein [Streptomyces sp. NBC_00145]|uniref:hypothetical protein n=1 Tax=Streptomyces sp. NBC_00145 TaxID=2975666 RepID=UPI002E16DC54